VFERFTERAREVVVLAQEEARRLRHTYIGTEHLLLGLLREDEGLAARVLEGLDITLEEVRAQVHRLVGPGDGLSIGQIPFTPRAKNVLELSLREAQRLKHDYISTEHILLGLVREGGGVGAQILRDFDADPETIRRKVEAAQGGRRTVHGKEAPFRIEGEDAVHLELGGEVVAPKPDGPPGNPRPAALLLAIVLAAVGFPLGLLAGFLIWG